MAEYAAKSTRPGGEGVKLGPLDRTIADDSITYSLVEVTIDRVGPLGDHRPVLAPTPTEPTDMAAFQAEGDQAYMLRLARELDDAILQLAPERDGDWSSHLHHAG